MFLDLYTLSSQKLGEASSLPVKKIAREMADLSPGSEVTVAKLNDVTIGVFQTQATDLGLRALLKQIKQLAPEGVIVRSCNYKEASEEELSGLFLTATLVCREASFKGFQHLTPNFMAAFAKARPNLRSLDLRTTKATYTLLDAYLTALKEEHEASKKKISELMRASQKLHLEEEEAEIAACRLRLGDVEANGIVVRIEGSDLTPEQKKELHLKYPYVALADKEETILDLSLSTVLPEMSSSESSLTFKHIALKVEHLPSLKVVDLNGHVGKFSLFSLVALEEKRGIHIEYEPPKKLFVPKSIDAGEELRAPSVNEIEAVLTRFYPECAAVDLCQLTHLSAFDILNLEEKFPKIQFSAFPSLTFTLPHFDTRLIERICLRYPEIRLELTHATVKEERELYAQLDRFPGVAFVNESRVTCLLEDLDLLKKHLSRALCKTHATVLSDDELLLLKERCSSLNPLLTEILSYRENPISQSVIALNQEIACLDLERVPLSSRSELNRQLFDQINHSAAIEDIELLLAKGADVNASGEGGERPLHLAARKGSMDLAELLLAKEANVNARDCKGSQPLHDAVRNGHRLVVELLLSKGAAVDARDGIYRQPLHLASLYGLSTCVKLLLANGADVQAKDSKGNQPLHYAAGKGRLEIVELLLAKGADVNAAGEDGDRSLHLASQNGHAAVVTLLIAQGAKVDAESEKCDQPLHVAVLSGKIYMVDLLLSRGAGINSKGNDGKRPLHLAASSGHIKMVELLLSKGADLDAEDKKGNRPLHDAVRYSNLSVVDLLLAKGANVNASGENGARPIHLATASLNYQVIRFLLAQGADPNVEDDCGRQPLNVRPGMYSCTLRLSDRKSRECLQRVMNLLMDNGAKLSKKVR